MLCIDTYGRDENNQLGLFYCAENKNSPQHSQYFTLRHFRDIELYSTMYCFDQSESGTLITSVCHHAQGNQYFRYNPATKQIHHGSLDRNECIDMSPSKMQIDAVFLAKCDDKSWSQKWNWGFVNETALANWTKFGTEIIDKHEVDLLKEISEGGNQTNLVPT